MMQRDAHLDPATIRAAVELLASPTRQFTFQSGTDSGTKGVERHLGETATGV
jgi:hypothetical protein